MKIGLLYEGINDEKPLQIIIKRIILQLKPHFQNMSFVSKYAGGSIDTHIKTAAILFYDTVGCDLGIFVGDTDGKRGKASRIRTLVTVYCKKVNPMAVYAIGCPDPELEQWFLDEEDAIKNYFHLPITKLPHGDLEPKERFLKILRDNPIDITVSTGEIYQLIASSINIDKLKENNDSFKRFYTSIKKAL